MSESDEMNDLTESLLSAPVVFGLVNQGHIPTICSMLRDEARWPAIGEAIGWCPATAREHFANVRRAEQWEPLVAALVERLRAVPDCDLPPSVRTLCSRLDRLLYAAECSYREEKTDDSAVAFDRCGGSDADALG